MLGIQPKNTVAGKDIYGNETLDVKISSYFCGCCGVSTDVASAVAGSNIGIFTKVRVKLNSLNVDANELCLLHYMIHQQKFACQVNKADTCYI
jgi:hypothetical protein